MCLIDPKILSHTLQTFKRSLVLPLPTNPDASWLLNLEKMLFDSLLEIGRVLLEGILTHLHEQSLWVTTSLAKARLLEPKRWRSHTLRTIKVETLFGQISFQSSYFECF